MRDIRVLLVSDRAAVKAFFLSLEQSSRYQNSDRDSRSFAIDYFRYFEIQQTSSAVPPEPGSFAAAVTTATIAIVDVMPNAARAIRACRETHIKKPALPLAALFCCPYSIAPDHLQAMITAGVSSLLDLQATYDEMERALYTMARGDLAVYLEMSGSDKAGLSSLLGYPHSHQPTPAETDHKPLGYTTPSLSQIDDRLVQLVARGFSDREIGQQLSMSPHTVKHHIERLRTEVRARNRIELAAWAGQQGFYHPGYSPFAVSPDSPDLAVRSTTEDERYGTDERSLGSLPGAL
jgi:DNA-binding NarL/FixJ family response regulator